MLTTNKLTKTFASGIATISIAAVAGIVNAPSASAQSVVCFDDNPNNLVGISVECGDKVFENFSTDFNITTGDVVSLETNGTEWDFDYDFTPDLVAGVYTYGYDVDIDLSNDLFFNLIELDTTIGVFPGVEVIKEIFDSNTGDLLLTLTSVDGARQVGSILPFNTKHISVIDTITITGQGILENVGNGFTQDTHDVPEPGTILGLLAVGGLGMVSRFKKQK